MSLEKLAFARRGFGLAWLSLCAAFGLHVWDESAHDFLGYYNATVLALYGHFSWFPRIDMTYPEWLIGVIAAVLICTALTPFAFRNARWLRPLAYLFGLVHFMNGVAHILAQIRGGTVPSVRFEGAGPGFYTAPLLLAGSFFLFCRLRQTQPVAGGACPLN